MLVIMAYRVKLPGCDILYVVLALDLFELCIGKPSAEKAGRLAAQLCIVPKTFLSRSIDLLYLNACVPRMTSSMHGPTFVVPQHYSCALSSKKKLY